jgi:cobalt-precorrin-5B (C1)-methyltransferase
VVSKRRDVQKLHTGFTTGACAAAASKAALTALLDQTRIEHIGINLPDGGKAVFTIKDCTFNDDSGYSSVIKNAGDDPDITNGIEIRAEVSRSREPGIHIKGGQGVGIVTKPGLEVPVGLPAINPVPRRMINNEVTDLLKEHPAETGIKIIISVPRGEELAKRTLNPRLGIIGGISILGTTGIVIPYSINAYKVCIIQSIDVAVATGNSQVVLTTGRRSEKFAQRELALPEECYIQSGDFIGFSLQASLKKQIKKVVIWGMIGKISKLALGHLYTNISDSEVNIDFLTALARDCGIPAELLTKLNETVSANHFREIIPDEYLGCVADRLCYLASVKCWEYIGKKLTVECILSDYNGIILGRAAIEK